MAARPRTLPAAIAPVLVGTALAGFEHVFHPLRFLAALLGAIFIQVGTNLSNDYSDARRGADAEDRLGPVRVTAGGLVPPRQVLIATYVSFGLAVLAGVYLIVVAGWQLLLVGAASILAGVPTRVARGRTATRGSARCSCSCSSGSSRSPARISCRSRICTGRRSRWRCRSACSPPAILVVNNVRDIDSDRRAGKRTLAVRLGPTAHPGAVRGDRLRRLPARAGDLGVRAHRPHG